jgi:glucosamine kinase
VTAGVDVGGTKTHLALSTGEERIVPSAEWHRRGIDGVADGIVETLRLSCAPPLAALAVGAHGCNDRVLCGRLERALGARLGELPILAVNDAELLLPSVAAATGVGVVAGTGSVAVGYGAGGEMLIAGGWGGYIGDEGSATGVFRDAGRAVAQAYDRGEPEDALAGVIGDALEIDHLRELPAALAAFGSPTAWAHLTPTVVERALERGSALIGPVIVEQARALAALIGFLRGRGADTSTVVAGGGLIVHAPWLQDALRAALAADSPASELVVLAEPPVVGALRLAGDLAALNAGRAPDGPVGPVLGARFAASSPAGAGAQNGAGPTPVYPSSAQRGTSHS